MSNEPDHLDCGNCGARHRHLMGKTQAAGCAAEIHDGNKISGYYGSAVIDMETWTFTEGGHPADGAIICDECLRGWIASGKIVMSGPSAEADAWASPTAESIESALAEARE